MHSRITQTILTLQQLKLNDKTIETILQISDSPSIDSKSLVRIPIIFWYQSGLPQ